VISHIDHFVLTVSSLEATCKFYERVLCMKRINALGQPTALTFKNQKINIHEAGRTFDPKARCPTPGAGDFCLIASRDIAEVRSHIQSCGVAIEVGPVRRVGAQGIMTSLYFRDPDDNLVEVSEYSC
jgi:catechol 2,3-dioxygenase-like lactoylglutathione lyase family enzyme